MVAKTKPATKKPSGKKPPAKSTDHAAVFTALRELLTPY